MALLPPFRWKYGYSSGYFKDFWSPLASKQIAYGDGQARAQVGPLSDRFQCYQQSGVLEWQSEIWSCFSFLNTLMLNRTSHRTIKLLTVTLWVSFLAAVSYFLLLQTALFTYNYKSSEKITWGHFIANLENRDNRWNYNSPTFNLYKKKEYCSPF